MRMADELIPQDVRQFVLDRIDSVAQLEALLLLRSQREQGWSCETISSRLYIDSKQAADILKKLCADHFAAAEDSSLTLYFYRPGSDELRQMIDRLAELYSRHLVPVTNLIHGKSKSRVQEFADAFRFRKDR